jgi:hypothetical protein
MGWLSRLFGRSETPPQPVDEKGDHSLVVVFNRPGIDLEALFALEERLARAIAEAGVGEYDGNEIAVDGSDSSLFMVGPDANALFAVAEPILRESPLMQGATIRVRYGPPSDLSIETVHVIG